MAATRRKGPGYQRKGRRRGGGSGRAVGPQGMGRGVGKSQRLREEDWAGLGVFLFFSFFYPLFYFPKVFSKRSFKAKQIK
jgi:hypothetical protein